MKSWHFFENMQLNAIDVETAETIGTKLFEIYFFIGRSAINENKSNVLLFVNLKFTKRGRLANMMSRNYSVI